MRTVKILYDTKFGNTEAIARSLASGLEEKGVKVDCVNVAEAQLEGLSEYDLIAIGGPTHGFGMSKPIKELMNRMESVELEGMKGFAFDTKNRGGMWGSAAKGIDKRLKRFGMNMVRPPASAIVVGLKGPLQEGMESMFRQIGVELADLE